MSVRDSRRYGGRRMIVIIKIMNMNINRRCLWVIMMGMVHNRDRIIVGWMIIMMMSWYNYNQKGDLTIIAIIIIII